MPPTTYQPVLQGVPEQLSPPLPAPGSVMYTNAPVRGIAASLASGPAAAASDLVRPLQNQAELAQQVLQRQLESERELVGRAAAPLHAAQDLVDQATGTFRAQATSFRAASTTFGQLAGLMDQQADLLERAGTAPGSSTTNVTRSCPLREVELSTMHSPHLTRLRGTALTRRAHRY